MPPALTATHHYPCSVSLYGAVADRVSLGYGSDFWVLVKPCNAQQWLIEEAIYYHLHHIVSVLPLGLLVVVAVNQMLKVEKKGIKNHYMYLIL